MSQDRVLSMDTSFESIHTTNPFNQPVGLSVTEWIDGGRAKAPDAEVLTGKYVILKKLNPKLHSDDLWEVFKDVPSSFYTYMFHGPFNNREDFETGFEELITRNDYYFFTIFDAITQKAIGYINLMRIDPNNGVIEVGCVSFSPKLAGTRMGTDVVYTLMKYVFDELNYRRFEWKCDSNNFPSRKAALRFGFLFEGMFRKAIVYRGRQRDTCWFAMLKDEFKYVVQPAFEEYLEQVNFVEQQIEGKDDVHFGHIKSLPDCITPRREAFEKAIDGAKDIFGNFPDQDGSQAEGLSVELAAEWKRGLPQ
jgi:RimJ/RimL family protein N-acetyltransferase